MTKAPTMKSTRIAADIKEGMSISQSSKDIATHKDFQAVLSLSKWTAADPSCIGM